MLKFCLLLGLGFASLYAALPTVKVVHQFHDEFDIKNAARDERLLLFSVDNPDLAPFFLKIQFMNKCFLKRLNRVSGTPFPLSSVKMRFKESYHEITDIWERTSPKDCEYFIVDFTEDIKKFYEIELLGSWGEGGHKLAPGTYGEAVILTVLPPQPR
jgi:hypothetical protein